MTGIIIQARCGSTRLPGKILKVIHDRTLLDHIIDRLKALQEEAVIVIATSTLPGDDRVEQFCREKGVLCFRGSESNVLSRYYECAREQGFDHIVRLTADNPFVDVEEVDRLIAFHKESGNDFSESFSQLPIGVGAEIFCFSALEEDMKRASMPHHFEHVDEYILENMDKFKTGTLRVEESKNRPDVRLTVDTQEDYEKACYIAAHSKTGLATTQEAISLCSQFV
ncbi:MAG: NTP transferase domain-containing protein [Lachnospiraceae bacterium]|jgi:spore coat polysaccharide biosynthesis protein SpsF|nr:NTP transferase domain-containing protein [Lachnospiraceae bacterium]